MSMPLGGSASFVEKWLKVLRRRWLTSGGNQCNVVVPQFNTVQNIPFLNAMATTNYGVSVSVNWNTTVWVSAKFANSCNVSFGTAAPTNATLDIAIFDSEMR